MQISARNVLKGKVLSVKHGTVNSEVTLEIAKGVKVVAMVTKDSAENLALKKGKVAYAIIKASSVMVGVDHD